MIEVGDIIRGKLERCYRTSKRNFTIPDTYLPGHHILGNFVRVIILEEDKTSFRGVCLTCGTGVWTDLAWFEELTILEKAVMKHRL